MEKDDINEIRDLCVDYAFDEKLLFLDGFDEAIVGIVDRIGQEPIVLYDKNKIIDIMIKRDGMTSTEALEYYYYNIIGSYVGEKTPAFLTRTDDM